MSNSYLKYFRIFFSISLIISIVLILLLRYSKAPDVDKKNFFTLSAKSPEYLIQPINIRDLLIPQGVPLPTVILPPNNIFYLLSNMVNEVEFFKKKYDNLFYAGKKISEIISWENELSWDKQLKYYSNLITKQINDDTKINDPRFRFNRLFLIYTTLLSHRQRLDDLSFNSTTLSDEKKRKLFILIDAVFDSLFKKVEPYVPSYQNAQVIYPLFDPLLDREYGTYEAQWVMNDLSVGNLKTINIDGKSNYLYWNNHSPSYPQTLKWITKTDLANNQYYSSEISFPNTEKVLAVIDYYFDKGALVSINHGGSLFSEIFYPRPHLTTIRKIVDNSSKKFEDSAYELTIYFPNQSKEEIQNALSKFSLVFFDLVEPEPQLLITKKSVSPGQEPVISLTKIDPFRYQLNISRTSFFNGRQIKYNLGRGWGIDDKKRILYYYPGIYTFYSLILFGLISTFLGLCLTTHKPLDQIVITNINKYIYILSPFTKLIVLLLNKSVYFFRFWLLLLGFFIIITETFLHAESSDLLILITVLIWIFVAAAYSLESRFSLFLSFIFFVSSILFIIIKKGDYVNYNADHISPYEIIANKFALWTIVFMIVGFISTLLELKYPIRNSRSLRYSLIQIGNDWKALLNHFNAIKTAIKTIINMYKPKSLAPKDLLIIGLKITFTIIVIMSLFKAKQIYDKRREFNKMYPVIVKIEPKMLYPSTKFIVYGRSFGSFVDGKTKLMSSYGQLAPDFWTDSRIYFTIPLSWQPGYTNIWIEKNIEFDGKKFTVKSKAFQERVIPRSDLFTPLDDLFFEQLKTLDKETLKLNGYE